MERGHAVGWPARLLRTCQEDALRAAHLQGREGPWGSPVSPAPDPRSSSNSASCGLVPPCPSLTCISSARPPAGGTRHSRLVLTQEL